MAFCTNCGKPIVEDAASCPHCGAVIYNHIQQPGSAQAGQYYQPPQEQAQPGAYYQPPQEQAQPGAYYQPPQQPQINQMPYVDPQAVQGAQLSQQLSSARTLGIVAIIAAFFSPLIAWICGGIGSGKANKAILFANQTGNMPLLADAQKAKRLNTIGIVLGACIVLFFVVIAVLGGGAMNIDV